MQQVVHRAGERKQGRERHKQTARIVLDNFAFEKAITKQIKGRGASAR